MVNRLTSCSAGSLINLAPGELQCQTQEQLSSEWLGAEPLMYLQIYNIRRSNYESIHIKN